MGLLSWLFGEKEESPPEQLVFGAELHCPLGSENSFLIVNGVGLDIGCLPGAFVDDCKAFVNIEPFGICAMGDYCERIMELDKQWVNEEPQKTLSNGKEIITTKSTLMCHRGHWEIYPVTSGQDGAGAKHKLAEWEFVRNMEEKYPGLLAILYDPYGSLYLNEGMYPIAVQYVEDYLVKNGGEVEFITLFQDDDPEKGLVKAALTHLLRGYDFTTPANLLDSMRRQGLWKELDQEPGWNDTVLTQDMMEILKGEIEDVAERMETDSFFRWQEEHKMFMTSLSDVAMNLAYIVVAIESAKPTEKSEYWREDVKVENYKVLEEEKVPESGTDVWDMTEGGGTINGREYSQHAMERMAPDTPSVRAELSRRAEAFAESKGLQVGTPEYYQFCQKYVDPRNVPPSVVEDAIRNTIAVPGHTEGTFVHQTVDVTVIVNETGKVITVMPK